MWKYISGYENLYEINEYGTIRKVSNKRELTPYISNKGYKLIDLSKNNIRKHYLVHRLVAQEFVPNPNNFPIVLHLDNQKLNTFYKNLKWGTFSENNSQAIFDGINTIPKPDNRVIFELSDGENSRICIGINDLMKVTEYPYSYRGLYNYIYRNNPIPYGPYAGYIVRRPILKEAVYYD